MTKTTFIHPRSLLVAAAVGVALVAAGCTGSNSATSSTSPDTTAATTTTTVASNTSESTGAPNSTTGPLDLTIGALPDSLAPLSGSFSNYVDVWGVNIVATSDTEDAKVLHAAHPMAQYLDNDADGARQSGGSRGDGQQQGDLVDGRNTRLVRRLR